MKVSNTIAALAIVAGSMLFSQASNAATVIGFAVDGVNGSAVGNPLVDRTAQGLGGLNNGLAIEYFIPLGVGTGGTYGDGNTNGVGGTGQVADSGTGGETLSMWLQFNVVNTGPHELTILFEDLDLIDANDPDDFFESVEVFDDQNNSITGLIDDISSILVTGDANTIQAASIILSMVTTPLFIRLDFLADSPGGSNTAEYLIAGVTPIPIPAALPLLAGGFGMLGLMGWRRKRKAAARAA